MFLVNLTSSNTENFIIYTYICFSYTTNIKLFLMIICRKNIVKAKKQKNVKMYFFFREGFERRKLGVKIISKFTKKSSFFLQNINYSWRVFKYIHVVKQINIIKLLQSIGISVNLFIIFVKLGTIHMSSAITTKRMNTSGWIHSGSRYQYHKT